MNTNYLLWIGLGMFLLLILAIFLEPILTSEENLQPNRMRFQDDGSVEKAPFAPNKEYIFGSDTEGRGIFDMLVIGTKDTLLIIFLITLIRYLIAIPLAFVASKKRGISHWLVVSLNTFFTSIPTLVAAIILVNLPFLIFSDNRYVWCVFILAFIEIGRVAYIFQQQAYDLSNKEFIRVAKIQGNNHFGIIIRHYIPYFFPGIITSFFVDLGKVTVLIGQLGLFNIFVTQQMVEVGRGLFELENGSYNWATLLASTRWSLYNAPWIPLFPALALFYVMLSFSMIGEGLKRHFMKSAKYL
ncbi:ABC transporter permease subunit [Litchfieldia alkalitelluris]|uniref:ABC transporter permease subunit n=1 Tax=Litchfieldia alkalitelluris TaxID=304268 RepID=UPI000998AB2A|nr:ABC transporter permease subunit [Litchfieldia alkalitelluris]